jgi:hypothetical protein
MTLQPAIGAVRSGCLCCPPKAESAPLDWDPDPGFGIVFLKRDGETALEYMHYHDTVEGGPGTMTVQDFEDRAGADPEHDWRFEIHGSLGGVVYQRHGEGRWVAIEKLEGFA